MPFRPAALPTVATVFGALITLNLAAWQWGRHLQQEARLAEVEGRIHAPPATAATLDQAPADLKWRKALLTGTFEAGSRAWVTGRFLLGQPGYQIVETFAVDGGPRLLVDRGWVPMEDWRDHAASLDTTGPQTLEGLLLPIEPGRIVTPRPADDRHPERFPQETESFLGVGSRRVGLPWTTLAERAGDVAGVYLVAGRERPSDTRPDSSRLPVDGYIAQPKVIGHLSYVGQWSLITVVMVIVWGWAGLKRGQRLAAEEGAAQP